MSDEHVWAGDVCSRKQAVKVGGQLLAVSSARRAAAPSFAGAVVAADAGGRRDGLLDPCPARGALPEPVEEDNRGRAVTDAVQIEAVAVDEIGASAERRVGDGRLGDGFVGASDRNEREHEEGGVEDEATRPVAQLAACAANRPHNKADKQDGPDPAAEGKCVLIGRECQEGKADDGQHGSRGLRPGLGLAGQPTRRDCEDEEAQTKGRQRGADDLVLRPAREDDQYECEAEQKSGHDRSEHDETDVALPGDLAVGAEADA